MSIQYLENEALFMIQTSHSTYAFCIDDNGNTSHRYWGSSLYEPADLPTTAQLGKRYMCGEFPQDDLQEYRGFGGYSFTEPALKVQFADGARSAYLKYVSHTIYDNILEVELADTVYPLGVTLRYTVYESLDIIERRACIKNAGNQTVVLDHAFSATWRLPHWDAYELTYLSGCWAAEYQIQQERILPGRRVLETRTGLSGPDAVPFFMIHEQGRADETSGGVYFFSLLWSGSFKMVVEKDTARRVSVTGGINDFDFAWQLQPGEQFETPVFMAGFTTGGYGQVSRNIHDYEREVIMHPAERNRLMPVVYNAYGTYFQKINQARILRVIEKAAQFGAEVLILDAGWQGVGGIETMEYRKGMGTWEVNHDRFPNGLKPIAESIHAHGMMFGLWVEPETVHPENPLIQQHPDWILKYENRSAELWNGAYVLNFAKDEVRQYMTKLLTRLITENQVDYLKIDFNRFIPQMGWLGAPKGQEREGWVRYVAGMYRCYNDIKKQFPDLLIENCAAGGMRADMGMLRFAGRMNRSDNQDALDMVGLHEGFSMFMLPKLAGGGCHISDVLSRHYNDRCAPMRFQAHVGMLGSLAVGKNLETISDEEFTQLQQYVALYKKIRPITQLGDLYRLVSPREKSYAAYAYVSKDKKDAVVFLLGKSMQFCVMPERLRLQGLEESKYYHVDAYGTYTGRGLMTVGLPITLNGDMKSELIRMTQIEKS